MSSRNYRAMNFCTCKCVCWIFFPFASASSKSAWRFFASDASVTSPTSERCRCSRWCCWCSTCCIRCEMTFSNYFLHNFFVTQFLNSSLKLRGTSWRFKNSFRSKCVIDPVDSFIHFFVFFFRRWSCGEDSFSHLAPSSPALLSTRPSCYAGLLWFLCFFSFTPLECCAYTNSIKIQSLEIEKVRKHFQMMSNLAALSDLVHKFETIKCNSHIKWFERFINCWQLISKIFVISQISRQSDTSPLTLKAFEVQRDDELWNVNKATEAMAPTEI